MDIGKAIRLVFTFALLCFLLPFAAVSCQNQQMFQLTGLQLVTGTTIEQPQTFGPPEKHELPANVPGIIAAIAGVAGVIFGTALGGRLGGVLGAVGALVLLLFKSQFAQGVASQGQGQMKAEFLAGFWGALFLFIGACVLGLTAKIPPPRDASANVAEPTGAEGIEERVQEAAREDA